MVYSKQTRCKGTTKREYDKRRRRKEMQIISLFDPISATFSLLYKLHFIQSRPLNTPLLFENRAHATENFK